MAKWAIELGEHDIDYFSQTCIKAQALPDFLVEISYTVRGIPKVLLADPLEREANKDIWELHTDDTSSMEGSGADLIHNKPRGDEITYSLRFDFQVSSNESEYEALLTDLGLAQEVGTKHLRDFSDSLLIRNRVNGTYKAKEFRNTFNSFKITLIPTGIIQEPTLLAIWHRCPLTTELRRYW